MDWSTGSDRILEADGSSATKGYVEWKPGKSLWISSMTIAAIALGPLYFSWSAFWVFLFLTGFTLCAGHSVGMHRLLIHRSFDCATPLEYLLVYLGVLVGMAGPVGMIRQHDLRDWAQRKKECHPYLCHNSPIWKDAFWQLHCDVVLKHPPEFELEPRLKSNRIYAWLERYWMWQQLPLALLLYAIGGISWVVWGIAVRVSISVVGHWLVGYYAHSEGPMRWMVMDAGIQGRDVPIAALLSMGESWHNNHHAFPGSAKIGLDWDQPDPGWWLICGMRRLGWVWNIKTPENLPDRKSLHRLNDEDGGCPAYRTFATTESQ